MRALPLISLCVAAQALGSVGQAVSIGNDGWGLDLTLSTPPRQCQALRLWYNVGPVSGAPDSIRYPDSAVVQFLTPDSSETQWMEWRPLNGTGIMSWQVPGALAAGKQFVVKNFQGYRQVFTVGSGSTSCGGAADSVTTSFAHGSLNAAVFKTLTTTNYSPYSISPDNQFHGVDMPSSGNIVTVPLGAPVRVSTPSSPSTSPAPSPDPDPVPNNDPGTTSPPTSSPSGGTSNPSSPNNPQSPSNDGSGGSDSTSGQSDSTTSTSTVASGANASSVPGASSAADNSPSSAAAANGPLGSGSSPGPTAPGSAPGTTETVITHTHDGTNIGAIVGGLVGTLVVGVLIGVFLVYLQRRRRRRANLMQVVPMPPMEYEPSVSLVAATVATADRKRQLFVPPPTDSEYRSSGSYAGTSEYPMSEVPDVERQAPPTYSRFA